MENTDILYAGESRESRGGVAGESRESCEKSAGSRGVAAGSRNVTDSKHQGVAGESRGSRKTSDAKMRANLKWQAKQSRLNLAIPVEVRELLESQAGELGISPTAYIIRAIKEQAERDRESR